LHCLDANSAKQKSALISGEDYFAMVFREGGGAKLAGTKPEKYDGIKKTVYVAWNTALILRYFSNPAFQADDVCVC